MLITMVLLTYSSAVCSGSDLAVSYITCLDQLHSRSTCFIAKSQYTVIGILMRAPYSPLSYVTQHAQHPSRQLPCTFPSPFASSSIHQNAQKTPP